jgi:hypothetical protein
MTGPRRFSSVEEALDSYGDLLSEEDRLALAEDALLYGACFIEVIWDSEGRPTAAWRIAPECH